MCTLNVKEIEAKLKQPFERKDVEFRIAKVNKKTRKAYVVAYISSRAAMDRLDAVFGQDGWYDEYEVLKNGVSCRLSVKFNGEFITKQDAAPFTNIEVCSVVKSAYLCWGNTGNPFEKYSLSAAVGF